MKTDLNKMLFCCLATQNGLFCPRFNLEAFFSDAGSLLSIDTGPRLLCQKQMERQ